jgi:hypothetical protein
LQLFPANGKHRPAALNNKKQDNEDQIQADKVVNRSGVRINQEKNLSPEHGHLKYLKPAATTLI